MCFSSYCRLKKLVTTESRELFYLVWMLRTLSEGDNISVALRKLPQGGRSGIQAIYEFATKWTVWTSKNIVQVRKTWYQVKEFNILLLMGRCKPLGSLDSFLLYVPQLSGAKSSLIVDCFYPNSLFTARDAKCGRWLLLASPQAPAITVQGGGICWIKLKSVCRSRSNS